MSKSKLQIADFIEHPRHSREKSKCPACQRTPACQALAGRCSACLRESFSKGKRAG